MIVFAGEGVSSHIFGSSNVLQIEVKISHLLHPAGQPAGEILHGAKVRQGVMIRQQLDFVLAVEVVVPVAACIDERQEFFLPLS